MGDTNIEITPPGSESTSSTPPEPTMGAALLKRIQLRNPELKEFKPSAPVVSTPESSKVEAKPEVQPAAANPDTTKSGEAQNKEGESDDDNHEIVEGDSAEVQLKKLAAAQKKTLKRIDKITAERNELEAKLLAVQSGKQGEEDAASLASPALVHVNTLDDLRAEESHLNGWIQHLSKHAGSGLTYKGTDGKEVEMSPEEVVNEIIFWTDVKANQVPARRQFLESRDQTRTVAAEKFKPWQTQKGFTDAKAAVEKGMKPAESLLPDYDLAVQERALGRMALSDELELVPKRKAPAGGVESAPAKKEPVVPPVNPPSSGGPPIRPAGAGPDVEALRLKMLASPGNKAAVQAYLKAKLSASYAA